jgi:BirA family biotin operon repressor/biotin-[acetyl-CoA-carboxylase] ligase
VSEAAFWRLRVHEHLASTQEVVLLLAQAGEPEGLAVRARRQSHGRGSRGRDWVGQADSLAISVLLRPAEPPRAAGQWALLAGLALAEALTPAAPEPPTLKWPNDVLLGGRKLGGVLLDSAADGARLEYLVIGMGANLGAAPEVEGREVGFVPGDAAEVSALLLERLLHWRRLRMLDGFAPVRAAWLALAHPRGTRLLVRAGGQSIGGTFEGLAEDGALLLASGGRVHAVNAGEILQAGG